MLGFSLWWLLSPALSHFPQRWRWYRQDTSQVNERWTSSSHSSQGRSERSLGRVSTISSENTSEPKSSKDSFIGMASIFSSQKNTISNQRSSSENMEVLPCSMGDSSQRFGNSSVSQQEFFIWVTPNSSSILEYEPESGISSSWASDISPDKTSNLSRSTHERHSSESSSS